jgi:hypothetical protein
MLGRSGDLGRRAESKFLPVPPHERNEDIEGLTKKLQLDIDRVEPNYKPEPVFKPIAQRNQDQIRELKDQQKKLL